MACIYMKNSEKVSEAALIIYFSLNNSEIKGNIRAENEFPPIIKWISSQEHPLKALRNKNNLSPQPLARKTFTNTTNH